MVDDIPTEYRTPDWFGSIPGADWIDFEGNRWHPVWTLEFHDERRSVSGLVRVAA